VTRDRGRHGDRFYSRTKVQRGKAACKRDWFRFINPAIELRIYDFKPMLQFSGWEFENPRNFPVVFLGTITGFHRYNFFEP
ncbi:hypothetical protein, partial [Lentimicrobium sp.]|uniref:hypothetical protein n=1 Tax=Lentimicrobium sp. TaxID=2034841 RepID=UPI00345E1E00